MVQVSGSEDVYRHFVEDTNESWLFGLACFAVFEEQRIEWMKHFENNNGGPPSADDIRNWYEQQPPSVLLRAKGTAENALELYADEVLQEVLEAERREVADGVIVSEIRLSSRLWPQFGINVIAGLISALLFAAVLVIVYFVAMADASPVKSAKAILGQSTEEITDGETAGE